MAHTFDLQQAHSDLNLRGVFKTESKGVEHGVDHNCFCYPLKRGAWVVRRYTPGVKEDSTWTQDGAGWTTCFLNREPDLRTAARAYGGLEDENGEFIFNMAEDAAKAALMLGTSLDIPNFAIGRRTVLKMHKDGRLVVKMKTDPQHPQPIPGWLIKKDDYVRMFSIVEAPASEELNANNFDDIVRHLVTSTRDDAGWVIRTDEKWSSEPLGHVEKGLLAQGLKPAELKNVVGSAVFRPWEITNIPFAPEYPGNRKWNRNAAQFQYTPTPNTDDLKFGTWLKIFQHCGKSLDSYIKELSWAQQNNILTGSDYLMCWVASVFQEPTQPLPYLFFWGNQNSGKSSFHEALSLLLTKGYVRADHALTSQSTFNGELENAIICVVEETNLKNNKTAANRIKDWVTSPMLSIRPLYLQPYMIVNTTHWIQSNNDLDAVALFPGDTRTTVMHVPDLSPEDLIPKRFLMDKLKAEAPDFLAHVLALELPPTTGRLNIPVIETDDKTSIMESNKTALEQFIEERCHYVSGECIRFNEFYDAFMEYVDPEEAKQWSKIRVGKSIPSKFVYARLPGSGYKYIGNMSFEAWQGKTEPKPRFVAKNGILEVEKV